MQPHSRFFVRPSVQSKVYTFIYFYYVCAYIQFVCLAVLLYIFFLRYYWIFMKILLQFNKQLPNFNFLLIYFKCVIFSLFLYIFLNFILCVKFYYKHCIFKVLMSYFSLFSLNFNVSSCCWVIIYIKNSSKMKVLLFYLFSIFLLLILFPTISFFKRWLISVLISKRKNIQKL